METGADGSPTPLEARAALQQLASDEDAVRYPPLPHWFFAVMAVLVALLFLSELLGGNDARNARLGLGVCATVLGARYWLYRDGVAWVKIKISDMASFLATVLGSFALCWAISGSTNAWWVWIVGAVAAGAVVLVTGRRYRQEFGDGE